MTEQCQFPEELDYLGIVEEKLGERLNEVVNTANKYEDDYKAAQKYLREYWSELDSKEIFSNQQTMLRIEESQLHVDERRKKVEKMVDSPYFARIDFIFPEDDEAEVIYVGKFSFEADDKILVYDWRAPVSSMYYDFELGKAAYEAPMGLIEGDITRKRQFKIQEGQMVYALESSISIEDSILQEELSRTSDEKMKSIISTIQREQNQIIRNLKADVLVIQGVAGSGKTSIALHRVAFLLYRYRHRLEAKNVAIISPNKVFSDYISNVLPELGEEPINEFSFAEIAEELLPEHISFEDPDDELETPDVFKQERIHFKSTKSFVSQLKGYLEHIENTSFEPRDLELAGHSISKEFLMKRYKAYKAQAILKRFDSILEDIFDIIETNPIKGKRKPSEIQVMKRLTSMFREKKTLEIYRGFYQHIHQEQMLKMPAKNALEWNDVFPYLYCQAFFDGIENFKIIQHLLIDEMQDYTPIQYSVIHKIFSCKMTILGDFGQRVVRHNETTPELFAGVFDNVQLIRLSKSYRSTCEIINFAKKIQNEQEIIPIERHGDQPAVQPCQDEQQQLAYIKKLIDTYRNSSYATLGILCKTPQQAAWLYEHLEQADDIFHLTKESSKFQNGITITTVKMSKGLEFDQVHISNVDSITYGHDYDRSLLFVACTRAMHKLTLSFVDSPSIYLPQEI